jgi:hypothetical protein
MKTWLIYWPAFLASILFMLTYYSLIDAIKYTDENITTSHDYFNWLAFPLLHLLIFIEFLMHKPLMPPGYSIIYFAGVINGMFWGGLVALLQRLLRRFADHLKQN